jgi:hypothetical protein
MAENHSAMTLGCFLRKRRGEALPSFGNAERGDVARSAKMARMNSRAKGLASPGARCGRARQQAVPNIPDSWPRKGTKIAKRSSIDDRGKALRILRLFAAIPALVLSGFPYSVVPFLSGIVVGQPTCA